MGENISYEESAAFEKEFEAPTSLTSVTENFTESGEPLAQSTGDEVDLGGYELEPDEFGGQESWQGDEQAAPSSPGEAFTQAQQYLASASEGERLDFFRAVDADPAYAQLLNQGYIEQQANERIQPMLDAIDNRHAYAAERAALLEQRAEQQLEQGNAEAERIYAAGDVRGLDLEQVREATNEVYLYGLQQAGWTREEIAQFGQTDPQGLRAYVVECRDAAVAGLRLRASYDHALAKFGPQR